MPRFTDAEPFLAEGDPDPVLFHGPERTGQPFLLVCDHAGNAVPARLGTLGLDPELLTRHIGIDVGAWAHATALADRLDVPAIGQLYSRLVIDCNRRLDAPDSIALSSDGIDIPANRHVGAAEANARWREIMLPYQATIAQHLARMPRQTCIVAMHTCTPSLQGGQFRPWHVGVIADRDQRIAEAVIEHLAGRDTSLVVGHNEPYRINPVTDYTLPIHAEGGQRPYVEFELRNDLFTTPEERSHVIGLLADALKFAMERLVS